MKRRFARLPARFALLRRKIVRERLSAEAIAAGWALGMFIGCAVPFGLQLIVSVPLAIKFKISKIGATLGTFITNPLTIIFIYPAQTYAANRIFFGGSISFERLRNIEWDFDSVCALGGEAFLSFIAGGLVIAAFATPLAYFIVKALVVKYRQAKTTHLANSTAP